MCLMVYLGVPQPETLIPWNNENPGFHVCEVIDAERVVHDHLSTPYVYRVGAHDGCGCGFQYGEYPQYRDETAPAMRASLNALASYLARVLVQTPQIELYACWDGEQSDAVESRRELTPSALESDAFYFRQKELLLVHADDAARHGD